MLIGSFIMIEVLLIYFYTYDLIDRMHGGVCVCVTCAKSRKDSLGVTLASALDLLADVPSLRQHNQHINFTLHFHV